MRRKRGRKSMGAGIVRFGAEVQIVVLFRVEHGVNGGDGGHADGAGRQACVNVCIVGGVKRGVVGRDAPGGEVAGRKYTGWVGL